jgi:hypothetical protein
MCRRYPITVLAVLLLSLPLIRATAQQFPVTIKGMETLCYGSDEVKMSFIPPPESFRNFKGSGGAEIEVTYFGFTAEAQSAFEYAVAIWASQLRSDIKIRVFASWTTMSEPGVLASASASTYYRGSFIGASIADAYYPVALAEKLAARNLNDTTDYEINVRFNSAAAWFYGTAGFTPGDKYDMVTVALHELCHGLGFADSFNTTATEGSYGLSTLPVIYDTFIEDSNFRRLVNTNVYVNPSSFLRLALIGNDLYFSGPATMAYTNNIRPRVYAPGTWDPGSSISHFNESTTPRPDDLMTPFVARGEAIHDPGKLTLSVLADLGWINTRLEHIPVRDTEENLNQVEISLDVKSDTLLKKNSLRLYYSYNEFRTVDSVILSSAVTGGSFTWQMSIPQYNTRAQYYFAVSDTFGRRYQLPQNGKSGAFSFFIGADTEKPAIDHTPAKFVLSSLEKLTISANIEDNLYPVSAVLEYRLNSNSITVMPMSEGDSGIFSAAIFPSSLPLTGTDTIFYRIVAQDSALNPNISLSPLSGYHKLPVVALFEPVESYFNAFRAGDTDFLLDGFSVSQPAGFTGYALHSAHPYLSSETPDKTLETFALLRYPVVIDSSGLHISFREIVLVEPGEPGAPFGTDDFFDYVVVEVSKDAGATWRALAEGYDSRDNAAWLTAYNSAITGQNSTYTGKPSDFIRRTITMDTTTFLDAGDILTIRFRLFSDPFATGWGWALDDLFIKSVISSSEKTEAIGARVWPNPGDGRFTLEFSTPQAYKETTVRVTDFRGRVIRNLSGSGEQTISIDISDQPAGIYPVVIQSHGTITTYRYLLIK